MEDSTIILLFILTVIAGFALFTYYERNKSGTSESFVPVGPIAPNGTPASAFYGEDNPIVAYNSKLIKCGKYAPNYVEADKEAHVYSQGVLTADDKASHYYYVRSNAGRYPIQQASDHTELRATRNAYIAGTRAMRAVQIRPEESVVPDKIERTVRPF